MSEAPKELRKQTPRNQRPGREDLWRGDGTVGEKHDLGVTGKEGRNAEVEEGRAKVTAGGGVTQQGAAGFEVLKQWLNSFRLRWMVEEARKTQLLLVVVSLGRQQR